MSIRSLNDLRPGDFMISGMNTAPTKLLVYGGQFLLGEHFRIGDFVAAHAGIVTSGLKVVEAMPSGARERDLTEADWSVSHAYFRVQNDYTGQNLDAAAIARAMVGVPYSIASYLYLAAYFAGIESDWLLNRINRRQEAHEFFLPSKRLVMLELPVEAICSVLADQAWTLTGKKLIHGTRPQVVTPGMLARHLLLSPKVIPGGKAFEI